jgi:hypothetical protein
MSISQNFPTIRPTLNLNFARSKRLDPRITFTRASTATYVDEDKLIKTAGADEARFDHDPVTGESLGLLIEESRTNLVQYSNNLTASNGWRNVSQSNMSAQNVSHPAPNGSNTVTELTGGGVNSWWAKDTNYLQSTTYTVSAYVKVADGGANFSAQFNLYTITGGGLAQGSPFTITSEWKRVSNVITTTSVTGIETVVVKTDVSGRKFYVWGIQVEQGSFPTSYIPTSGSAVTRQPDIAQITGTNFSSWYNQSEGTIYGSWRRNSNTANTVVVSTDDGSFNNRIELRPAGGNSGFFRFEVSQGGVTDLVSITTIPNNGLGNSDRAIFAYKLDDYAASGNGSSAVADTSSLVPVVNRLILGDSTFGIRYNGTIDRVLYYPERLTNDQLQNLTK